MMHVTAPRGSTIHVNGLRFLCTTGVRLEFLDRLDSLTIVHPDGEREVVVRDQRG